MSNCQDVYVTTKKISNLQNNTEKTAIDQGPNRTADVLQITSPYITAMNNFWRNMGWRMHRSRMVPCEFLSPLWNTASMGRRSHHRLIITLANGSVSYVCMNLALSTWYWSMNLNRLIYKLNFVHWCLQYNGMLSHFYQSSPYSYHKQDPTLRYEKGIQSQ